MHLPIAGACRCSVAVVMLLGSMACGGGGRAKSPETLPKPELNTSEKIRMAQSYLNSGRTADALTMLEEVITEDPENANVHNFKGQVLFFAGRYPEAEIALELALQHDPHLTDAHNNLGAVLDAQGRKSEAENQYREVLADPAYPTPEKAYMNLGRLYESQGRDREAIDELRRAVEIDTEFYTAHFELASVLEKVGELKEALREYEVAAPGYRRDGRYYYRLGLAYFRMGRKSEARESLLRAVDLAPGSPSAAQADDLLEMID